MSRELSAISKHVYYKNANNHFKFCGLVSENILVESIVISTTMIARINDG